MVVSERIGLLCFGLGAFGLGFFVYANTFVGEFVWDDASSILLHESVQDSSGVLKLFVEDQHAYAGGQGNFYRPLVAMSFWVDFWLSYSGPGISESDVVVSELSPFLFHLDSILWHCLSGVFLMLLLRNFGASVRVCGVAALLYVVHPLHTEAVSYISGRADSMSAVFLFGGLYCGTRRFGDGGPRGVWFWCGVSLLCFVCGLLSKESSFIFPALLVLGYFALNRIEGRGWQRHQWVLAACTGVVLGVYGLLRTGSGPLNFGSDSGAATTGFGERVVETLQSFAYYLGLLFIPSSLHMERTLESATWITALLGFLGLCVCLCLAGYGFFRGRYRILFGASWFMVCWLPISGLFPLNAPMAEHWMYVPLGGFLWVLVELLFVVWADRVGDGFRVSYGYGVGVLVCVWGVYLALTGVGRNPDWSSNQAIYEATLRENPRSSRVHYNLAVTYEDMLGNAEGAKRHFRSVLGLYRVKKAGADGEQFWDEEIESHFSLGQMYLDEGSYVEAANHFGVLGGLGVSESNREVVGLSLFGLGQCYLNLGDRAGAERILGRAAEVLPSLGPEVAGLL